MPNTAEYKNYLFVQVKSDGYDFEIDEHLFYKAYYMGMDSIGHMAELPPGSYQIIGKGDGLSESDWEDIVEIAVHMENFEQLINDGWWNYEKEGTTLETATESGHSLLRSLGMEPGTTLVLKKKS